MHTSTKGAGSLEAVKHSLHISSPAFREMEMIPEKYTCDGKNISPPIEIDNLPSDTKSIALIVDDPDAPVRTWVHWVMWNIPVRQQLLENEAPGMQGLNDFQQHAYGGPCPPSGTHAYFFKVYALDTLLDLSVNTRKDLLEHAMEGHVLAFGQLVGLYRSRKH